jgi:hypothetical protein
MSVSLKIDIEDMVSRSTKRHVAEARILLAALSFKTYGHRATSVAKLLRKEPGSVSRWLAKSSRYDLPKVLDRLDRYIMSLYQNPDLEGCGSQSEQLGSDDHL